MILTQHQAALAQLRQARPNIAEDDLDALLAREQARPTRCYVRVNDAGVVVSDLEVQADDWDHADPLQKRIVPTDLVDVTMHEQWAGLGSLMGYTRQEDGSFTAPEA